MRRPSLLLQRVLPSAIARMAWALIPEGGSRSCCATTGWCLRCPYDSCTCHALAHPEIWHSYVMPCTISLTPPMLHCNRLAIL